ncbi:MAG: hypothetical protein KJO69_10295 [Gammaproteobacteria bacterium]|nr:hypothetical protein [Gammaproteobacteria bacterium]
MVTILAFKNGTQIPLGVAQELIYNSAAMTGYDPEEVESMWSRMMEPMFDDDPQLAADELAEIDPDRGIEFVIVGEVH